VNDELAELAAMLYEQCGGAFDAHGKPTDDELWLICRTRALVEHRAYVALIDEMAKSQPELWAA
jgi:hypothetical protein